jgi:D-lactate dehydrogenase (cytochrome)
MIRKTDPQTIAPYLKDASNFSGGHADEVVIPETTAELIEFLKKNRLPVTVAGAGTGLTASRIPDSGVIVSLEKFNTIGEIGDAEIDVGPAVSLKDLKLHLQQNSDYFYPPNPTETLASFGGMVATNASGSRSYKLGVTRDYVLSADIVLVDGRSVTLNRGSSTSDPMVMDDGSEVSFPDIDYSSPSFKNAAGYYIQPGMDWLDLFIGSDGTLGLFTRIRLKLLPRPEEFVSGILFFDREESCWELVEKLRSVERKNISPCSLEYFDCFSLKKLKKNHVNIPINAKAALFFEQDVSEIEDYDSILETWFEFLTQENVSLDDSWFAQNSSDVQRFHEFRHDIPILINEENSRQGRVKIGTDMAVPDEYLIEMMCFYRKELSASGLEYVVFGHLGDNHLHINLLPSPEEMDRAKSLYELLVNQILKWGGTISAEHGVGKLKKSYFAKMVGREVLQDLRKVKNAFDPDGLLGTGNIL